MRKSNYINKMPNGEPIGNEKASTLLAFCDEEPTELPLWDTIPAGLVLVAVADNGSFEAAMVVDNTFDYQRVSQSLNLRPTRLFLVKREWVNQMADRPLEGEV